MKPTKKPLLAKARVPLLDKMNMDDINILVPLLVKMFQKKSSKDNVLSTKTITTFFTDKRNTIGFTGAFSSQRLQKLVNYIRVNSILPIISTNNGYYYSEDRQDIMDMIENFQGRIDAMKAAQSGLQYIITEQKIKDAKKVEECSLGFMWN